MQILITVSWMLLGFCRTMCKKSLASLVEKHHDGLKPMTHTMFTMDLYPTHYNEAQKCFDDSIHNAQKDFNK
jgi:hypothetical protein